MRLDAVTGGAIHLDGLLTEAAWQRADPATGFRQQEPSEGAPATEETEVRVLYDGRTLYVGVLARDREPDRIIARTLQRDRLIERGFDGLARFAGDDGVAILLDPFHDHRNGFVFATNPNGAEFDALVTDEGREFNTDWRGIWSVAARRTADGWSAEFAIPFRTLRYATGPGPQAWGFNVYRAIRRKNEETLWRAWSRQNEGFLRASRAGHLEGLADLPRSGLSVELKPYVLAGRTDELVDDRRRDLDPHASAGVDLKYEIRPGLLLDVTANTDFAQVEVDDQQVNLTRFDLFYPEKRDFFLENSGIFEFGVRSPFEPPPFLLFFSRRIGIAEDGEVPVLGGARMTGRAGAQTIGLLDVVTDSAFGVPRTNYSVIRLKRDVGASDYVGAMLADRRQADSANTAFGVDWSYWPAGALNVQGFLARTVTEGLDGDGDAYRLGIAYQTSRFGFSGQHLYIGPDADPQSGFITRADIRRTGGFARVTPRPRAFGLRKLDLFWFSQYITRADGVLQDWNAGPAVAPEWHSGDAIVLYYQRSFTRLDEAFDLTDSVTVPAGDYHTWQTGWFATTSANRPLTLNSQGSLQRFFGGRLLSVSGTLRLALGPKLALAAGYTHNDVDIPAGAFDADIASLRFSYAFSTRLFVNALLQYNSLDKNVSANVRLNLIHRPGSDLFVVFNEQRGSDRSAWDFASRSAVVKLTYLARF